MENIILQRFIKEGQGYLDEFETELVLLQEDRSNQTVVASIFRKIHTIQGTGSFLNLPQIGHVSSQLEAELRTIRDSQGGVSTDQLNQMETALNQLTNLFRKWDEKVNGQDTDEQTADEHTTDEHTADKPTEKPVAFAEICQTASQSKSLDFDQLERALELARSGGTIEQSQKKQPPKKKTVKKNTTQNNATQKNNARDDQTALLIQELTLVRNQFFKTALEALQWNSSVSSLNHIVTQLNSLWHKKQTSSMADAWSALPNYVEELAQLTGKPLKLKIEGGDLPIDSDQLMAVLNPLIHILRNAVDHGVESLEERRAQNKPKVSTLTLQAISQPTGTTIQFEDDGRGLDIEKISTRAVTRGLVTTSEVQNLSEKEIAQFIFEPGFTTTDCKQTLSGNGVGMDVVKTEIEKLGGDVTISFTPNSGTQISLFLPHKSYQISGQVLRCYHEQFVIDHTRIREITQLSPQEFQSLIEKRSFTRKIDLQGETILLVHLREFLWACPEWREQNCNVKQPQELVILDTKPFPIGLIIPEIEPVEEMTVFPFDLNDKPDQQSNRKANHQLRATIFHGSTLLQNGKTALIFHVNRLNDFLIASIDQLKIIDRPLISKLS